jgi:NAD(P) transhydrogenase subunit alpha
MKLAILTERRPDETRVAATPDTVKKYVDMGMTVVVESGAGAHANFSDGLYQSAGASVVGDFASALQGADLVLKVQRPLGGKESQARAVDELAAFKQGAVLVGALNPYQAKDAFPLYNARQISAFAMELMPRITRAQSMDVLSSQANLAGYKAVLDAAAVYDRAIPMMMTAAGTIAPARVLVLGAGVAGLQAIATARRNGAIVSAFDVRAAAKEQVQSLGASFVEVEAAADAETSGGYAKEVDEDYKKRQSAKIHETLKKIDIAICTALIPGRPAPMLITEEMVRDMRPGSVIVDLAVESGGNCAISQANEVVTAYGVKVVAYRNVPARLPQDASALYAKNLLNFVSLLWDKQAKQLAWDSADEIIKSTLLTQNGVTVHGNFA